MTPDLDDPIRALGLHQPSAARIYDYLLGGSHNFAVDRTAAGQLIHAAPGIVAAARANREFLARAVRYAIGYDITQFLDLGAGIPTAGCTHQVARQLEPHARVVYVDRDPIAVAAIEQTLATDPYAGAVQADLRDIRSVLTDPVTTGLLDLTQPVAVLLVSVLHFVSGDAAGITRTLAAALPPGSLLVISHGTARPEDADTPTAQKVTSVYADSPTPLYLRTHDQILELFTGFELAGPGLVPVDQWRPTAATTDLATRGFLAGVGHRTRPSTAAQQQRQRPRNVRPLPTATRRTITAELARR